MFGNSSPTYTRRRNNFIRNTNIWNSKRQLPRENHSIEGSNAHHSDQFPSITTFYYSTIQIQIQAINRLKTRNCSTQNEECPILSKQFWSHTQKWTSNSIVSVCLCLVPKMSNSSCHPVADDLITVVLFCSPTTNSWSTKRIITIIVPRFLLVKKKKWVREEALAGDRGNKNHDLEVLGWGAYVQVVVAEYSRECL